MYYHLKNVPALPERRLMSGSKKIVRSIPLTPQEEQFIESSNDHCDFVEKFGSFIRPTLQCTGQQARMLATAFAEFLTLMVTETESLRVPSLGVFKRVKANEIRFYPHNDLWKKFGVVNENKNKCLKFYRKTRGSKKATDEILGLTKKRK